MARFVYYHHPQAENFSLKDSSASQSVILSRRKDLDGATKLVGYPFDPPVYVLYESDTEIKDANEIDFDQKWLTTESLSSPVRGRSLRFD